MTEYIGRYDQTYQQVNVQAQTKSKQLQFPDYKFIKKKEYSKLLLLNATGLTAIDDVCWIQDMENISNIDS